MSDPSPEFLKATNPVIIADPYDERHFKAMHVAGIFECQTVQINDVYEATEEPGAAIRSGQISSLAQAPTKDGSELRKHENEAILDSLLRDVFMAFYRNVVDFDPSVPNMMNQEIIKSLLNNPKFQMMRYSTHLKDLLSVVATDKFLDELMRRLGGTVQKVAPELSQSVEKQKAISDFKASLESQHQGNQESEQEEKEQDAESDGSSDEKEETDSPEQAGSDEQPGAPNTKPSGDSSPDDSGQSSDEGAGAAANEDQDGGSSESVDKATDPTPTAIIACQRRLENERNKTENLTKQLREELEEIDLDQAIDESLDEAGNTVESTKDIEASWGLGPAGSRKELKSLKSRRALASDLMQSKKFRAMVRMAGRFVNLSATKRRSEAHTGSSEIVDIDLGSSYVRMLPQEKALLHHPMGRLLVFRRLLEHGVMEYKMKSRETMGEGPLVICFDQSGSMALGKKDVWAKAFVLAMICECHRRGRKMLLLEFGAAVRARLDITRTTTQKEVFEFLKMEPQGGTNYEPPLREAANTIAGPASRQSPYRNADVIFLTDGQGCIRQETVERLNSFRKDSGASIFVIGIFDVDGGGGLGGAYGCEQDLRNSRLLDVADFVLKVDAAKLENAGGDVREIDALLDFFWKVQGKRLSKRAAVEFE